MKRGIERALLHLEHGAGHLLEPLRDGVPVDRAERDDLQDEHVERALEQVGLRLSAPCQDTLHVNV